jgi:hypothetical protein
MRPESIYEEQYRGETYRAGVAYLRARSPSDPRAPRKVGAFPLDTQRQIIAKAARANGTIIVAEFIEYGDRRGFRAAFTQAVSFACEMHIRELVTVGDPFLSWRGEDFSFLMGYLKDSEIDFVPAYDRWKQV